MKERNEISQRIKHRNISLAFIGTLLLLLGCELSIGGPDSDPDPVTEILGFKFSPSNVVSVGDSLTIKVIVKDSLDTDLRYSWSVGIHGSFDTEKNSINFIVKEDQGTVFGAIRIKEIQGSKDPIDSNFQFEIKGN